MWGKFLRVSLTVAATATFVTVAAGCAPTDEDRIPGEGSVHVGSERDVTEDPLVSEGERDPGYVLVEPVTAEESATVAMDEALAPVMSAVWGEAKLASARDTLDGPSLSYAVPFVLSEEHGELLQQALLDAGAEPPGERVPYDPLDDMIEVYALLDLEGVTYSLTLQLRYEDGLVVVMALRLDG